MLNRKSWISFFWFQIWSGIFHAHFWKKNPEDIQYNI